MELDASQAFAALYALAKANPWLWPRIDRAQSAEAFRGNIEAQVALGAVADGEAVRAEHLSQQTIDVCAAWYADLTLDLLAAGVIPCRAPVLAAACRRWFAPACSTALEQGRAVLAAEMRRSLRR